MWMNIARHKVHMLVALFAVAVAGVLEYGLRTALIVLLAMASAQLADWAPAMRGVGRRLRIRLRGGALITGALVGLILPPTAPFWSPVLASAAGILIAKHAVRGLFNPVVVGILLLVAIAPSIFTGFTLGLGYDGLSGASQPVSGKDLLDVYLRERIGGGIGESSGLVILLSGIYLIAARTIDWSTPVILLSVVAALSLLYGDDYLVQIATGGLPMAAFFVATDPATRPRQRTGRVLHALWLGVIVIMLRRFTAIPSEGVAYGLLIMNAATPLLNWLTSDKRVVD